MNSETLSDRFNPVVRYDSHYILSHEMPLKSPGNQTVYSCAAPRQEGLECHVRTRREAFGLLFCTPA